MEKTHSLANSIFNGHVSLPEHVLVIAEIGINHNGSLEIAKNLISMAKECGCDAVKFQKRTIDVVYSAKTLAEPRESPWGTTQREQKEGLEFSIQDYKEIDRYCKELDIDWFFSAWDLESQRLMRHFGCKYNKIASAMLTHQPLLEEVAGEGKLTFISTGMSSLEDIDRAVRIFREKKCPFVLMHTVSTYPSPEKDLNLSSIPMLRDRYDCPVGYSGHESSVSPSLIATMLGAVAIERHITLNRAMYGSDQAASLEKPGLSTLVAQIRKIPEVMGDGIKKLAPGEEIVAHKLRYWV
jgi:N-acetylneuraminate synthase